MYDLNFVVGEYTAYQQLSVKRFETFIERHDTTIYCADGKSVAFVRLHATVLILEKL